MNIAPSPDPAPLPAPGQSSTTTATLPDGLTEILFADLLGAPSGSAPAQTPGPGVAPALPRKPPLDTTDPALATLLPFLLPQAAQAPQPPPWPAGDSIEIAAGNSATPSPLEPGGPGTAQSRTMPPSLTPAGIDRHAAEPTSEQPVPFADALRTAAGEGLLGPMRPGDPDPMTSRDSGTAVAPAAAESAQPKDAAQPALPGKNPPAEFSGAAVQLASSPASQPADVSPENRIGQMRQRLDADPISAQNADGTTAAMERRAMPEHFIERQLKPKANGAAVASAPGEMRAVIAPGIREHPIAARRNEPAPAAPANAVLPSESPADNGRGTTTPIHAPNGTDAPAAADLTAAARITKQTIDLAEHVREMGRDHVEVQMRLRDGQEVTVSLRLEQGEWKPVFKTDTEALCRALEQNWHRAAAQPSAQAVRFGTPVFESQQAQADPGRNPQQQPDGRERSSRGREQDPAFGIPTPPTRAPATAANPTRASATTAVQLYA